MRNVLALTTAAAALMWVGLASAQDATVYVTQDASGNRMVMGGTDPAGTPLLAPGGDVAPGDCPEGSYWVDSQQRIHACQGEDVFLLQAPEAGAMMPDGQPFPEGSMLLVRDETAGGTGAPSGDNANNNQATDRQDSQGAADNKAEGQGGGQGGGGQGGGGQGGGGQGGGG